MKRRDFLGGIIAATIPVISMSNETEYVAVQPLAEIPLLHETFDILSGLYRFDFDIKSVWFPPSEIERDLDELLKVLPLNERLFGVTDKRLFSKEYCATSKKNSLQEEICRDGQAPLQGRAYGVDLLPAITTLYYADRASNYSFQINARLHAIIHELGHGFGDYHCANAACVLNVRGIRNEQGYLPLLPCEEHVELNALRRI